MKEKCWILNHYATNMITDKGGRHYWFAEKLKIKGYEPIIFCSNVRHNSDESIDLDGELYKIDFEGMVPFVFVKTRKYKGNGKDRVLNIHDFYHNMFKVEKKYAAENGKPDVIIASSVHPLTLVAGIKISKKLGVPCICEIRDLWPLSLVELGKIKSKSMINKVLYKLEKWIYTKADGLIFTMEGGKQYIIDQGWDKENGGPVDLDKVHHINNGVDLEQFDYNKEHYTFEDEDLDDGSTFKIIYTGSIRKANNLDSLLKVAEILKSKNENITFLIYGSGNERDILEQYCLDNNLSNVVFKGQVEKKYIPYILSKGNLLLMHFADKGMLKYGFSLNKSFEYLASGKPILQDVESNFDYIESNGAGVMLKNSTTEDIAREIIRFKKMNDSDYNNYCENARRTSEKYDFKILTNKLENIIIDVCK